MGGILWALITIGLGLTSIASYLTSQSEARFVELVQTRHTQALIAVSNNATAPDNFGRAIGDPVYQRPFSGQYWQITGDDGSVFVSPSLVDTLLPAVEYDGPDLQQQQIQLPDGELVLCISQWLTMDDGHRWNVKVAASLDQLREDAAVLRRSLLSIFGLVALIGILGALVQVTLILKPLNDLRKEVSDRWEHEDGLNARDYPIEVAPLVTDINTLLERNREILRSSRRQAADLAHAIKTPSAIMRNELEQLQSKGQNVTESVQALDRLDAQLKRSFARMRADASDGTIGTFTDLDTSLGRMKRAFTALSRNADRTFEATLANGLRVRMDQNDFEEVIGNLLDNAVKWSASKIALTAELTDEPAILIRIEDDGPGIPDADFAAAIVSGKRLDVSKPGTGLGLAIASDLVHAYGGTINLSRSARYGGLVVQVQLPVPAGPRLVQKEHLTPTE
jgi:signal transduction histidine kinase